MCKVKRNVAIMLSIMFVVMGFPIVAFAADATVDFSGTTQMDDSVLTDLALVSPAYQKWDIYDLFGGNDDDSSVDGKSTVNFQGGWMRGVLIGGGNNDVSDGTVVNITGGFIGPAYADSDAGDSSVYGGPKGNGNTVSNGTEINISNAIIRRHVLGGGYLGGNVEGGVAININGAEINGSIAGGGGGGTGITGADINQFGLVTGDISILLKDATIAPSAGSNSSSSGYVFGGGYGNNHNVTGNVSITIDSDTVIQNDVFGGGKNCNDGNILSGKTEIIIVSGDVTIGGNIVAGAQGNSQVNNNTTDPSTIVIRNVSNGDSFESFGNNINTGNIDGDTEVIFDSYKAGFNGIVGQDKAFDTLKIINGTEIKLSDANANATNWEIDSTSTLTLNGALNIPGNLAIASGSTIDVSSGDPLVVSGNLTGNDLNLIVPAGHGIDSDPNKINDYLQPAGYVEGTSFQITVFDTAETKIDTYQIDTQNGANSVWHKKAAPTPTPDITITPEPSIPLATPTPEPKGWQKDAGNGLGYITDSGSKLSGWQLLTPPEGGAKIWYFFKDDGHTKSGWILDKGLWYYMGTNYKMLVGWHKLEWQGKTNWYFFNTADTGRPLGSMRTGWFKRNGNWYYLLPNRSGNSPMGSMATGWHKINDKGKAKWFYLDEKGSGKMITGWVKWNSKWYYLNVPNGDMVIGTVKIGSKTYSFDSSGAMK